MRIYLFILLIVPFLSFFWSFLMTAFNPIFERSRDFRDPIPLTPHQFSSACESGPLPGYPISDLYQLQTRLISLNDSAAPLRHSDTTRETNCRFFIILEGCLSYYVIFRSVGKLPLVIGLVFFVALQIPFCKLCRSRFSVCWPLDEISNPICPELCRVPSVPSEYGQLSYAEAYDYLASEVVRCTRVLSARAEFAENIVKTEAIRRVVLSFLLGVLLMLLAR